MRINIELDTRSDSDLFALKALIDTLAGDKVLVDRGVGPLKDFDVAEVTIWSSDEHGEMAKQSVNLDENVGDVVFNTIPKSKPTESKEVVADCGNSLSLEDNATGCVTLEGKETITGEVHDVAVEVAEQEADAAYIASETAAMKAATAKKLAAAKRKEKRDAAKAVVDVETPEVSVKGASVDKALAELDPEPPTDKPIDHAAALRGLMVDVVKAHGPRGAKLASQVVSEIAGVKDVTKIPADKFDAVKAGLRAAIAAKGDEAPASPPAAKEASKVSEEDNPTASDVDF